MKDLEVVAVVVGGSYSKIPYEPLFSFAFHIIRYNITKNFMLFLKLFLYLFDFLLLNEKKTAKKEMLGFIIITIKHYFLVSKLENNFFKLFPEENTPELKNQIDNLTPGSNQLTFEYHV